MNLESLNDENFLLFCAKHYDSAGYNTEEFFEDINRIKYLKKLITRYKETGELKERLILNHIIILNNIFGAEITCKILYFKMKDQMEFIKPFLIFLNIMPERLYNIGGEIIITDEIKMDSKIIEVLRKI